MNFPDWKLAGEILASFIALSVSFVLTSFGGMFNRRAKMTNIALEGIMITGATSGLFVTYACTNIVSQGFPSLLVVVLAVLASGSAGFIFAMLNAIVKITFHGNQYVAGIAINILGTSLFVILAYFLIGQDNLRLPSFASITAETFGGTTRSISAFWDAFLLTAFNNLATITALILIPISYYILDKSRLGFRLKAYEENEVASRKLGIPIKKTRYTSIGIGGFIAGIGGFSFLYGLKAAFNGQIYGYGFLALAIVLIGREQPGRILFTSLLFSAIITLGDYAVQIFWLPNFHNIVNGDKIYYLLPYLLVLIVLAWACRRQNKQLENVKQSEEGK
ncbi:MAG: hypothetical protein PHW22_01430 [Bacilli bacterium]|nr:hypothetical protein [Bacilli bacterium]